MAALVMVGEIQWSYQDRDLNLNQAEKVMWERRWLRSLFPNLRVWIASITVYVHDNLFVQFDHYYLELVVASDGPETFLKNLSSVNCV